MDILSLNIHNFCAIGDAHIELDKRGLILIQGVNDDDTSTKSNGAGKSSLVDALCWVIYGTTARDESGDDIVNNKAKKDTHVSVLIDDVGTIYRIERYRKHATHKNALFVWQSDASGAWMPLHKGIERETQEVILKIMGCSHEVFKGAIYAGQEQMPNLPGMTDKFLKLLVEEAAGVEELAEAYTETSKQALVVEKELAASFTQRDTLKIQLDAAQDALTEAVDQEKLFEATRKDRAKAELAKVPGLQHEVTALASKIAATDKAALTARKTTLEAQLAAVSSEHDELRRLDSAVNSTTTAAGIAINEATRIKREFDACKLDLSQVEAMVGKPCGECGKSYCEHDIEAVQKLRQAAVTKAAIAARDSITKAQAANEAQKKALNDRTSFRAKMTDVSAASAELNTLNEQLDTLRELERDRASIEDDIASMKKGASAKLTEPNGWTAHKTTREAKLVDLERRHLDALTSVEILEDRLTLLKEAAQVFGPAGVRAHVLDTVTPFLNHQTGEYLGALADGNIHATWSTLTANAKGELKEKFSIAVENDHGGKKFGLQSGGEKRKVRLSTALALQDLVASRATKPINIFIADEVDDALDESGLERLMGVLDGKAKERGTVLVVSHNALGDWIDQTITVTKSGGKSTVTGATVAGF